MARSCSKPLVAPSKRILWLDDPTCGHSSIIDLRLGGLYRVQLTSLEIFCFVQQSPVTVPETWIADMAEQLPSISARLSVPADSPPSQAPLGNSQSELHQSNRPTKREQVTAACDSCRRKKIKVNCPMVGLEHTSLILLVLSVIHCDHVRHASGKGKTANMERWVMKRIHGPQSENTTSSCVHMMHTRILFG